MPSAAQNHNSSRRETVINYLYSLGDVAQRFGLTTHKIHYLLACHQIAEPRLRIGSRRIWSEAELVEIADTLNGTTNTRNGGKC